MPTTYQATNSFDYLPLGGQLPGPGDLVGFSGADLLADAINLGSLGIPRRGLSHVGIIAYHAADGLCLYESTTTAGLTCLDCGEFVDGMQCHRLVDRVVGYPGRVWHYPLQRPPTKYEAGRLEIWLGNLCRKQTPYDYAGALRSRSTLIALAVRAKFGRESLGKLFCSELVAAAWAKMRILKTYNASRWNPNSLARYAVRHGITDDPVEWTTAPGPWGADAV